VRFRRSSQRLIQNKNQLNGLTKSLSKSGETTVLLLAVYWCKKLNLFYVHKNLVFLSDIGFSKFDLGTLPFQIYDFKVIENKERTLVLEVNFRWQSDFEIVLYAKVGLASPDVLVQDLELDATSRVTITFTDNALPIASKVKVQLTERPHIDIGVSPIASSLDIMELPGLSSWIKSIIENQVVARMCPPQAIEVDLEAIMEAQKNKPPSDEPKLSLKEKISMAQSVGNKVGAAGNVGVSAVQGVGSGVMAVGQGVGNLAKGFGKGIGGLGKSITGLGKSSHSEPTTEVPEAEVKE